MKRISLPFCLLFFLSGCATVQMIRLEPTPYIPYDKADTKITYVYRNSEAEKAGFEVGDSILEIDGQKIDVLGVAEIKLKELAEADKTGVVEVKRAEQIIDIKFKPNKEDKRSFGLLLLPEHYTVEPGKNLLRADLITKDGVSIGVMGLAAQNNPLASMMLVIQNYTDEDIAIYPNDILVLDGNNTILKIFGGKVVSAVVKERAESDYADAKSASAAAMSYAQSLPPTYKITGGTTELGTLSGNMRGTLYSYGNYGQYSGTYTSTYSGSSYSNYTLTPQPNVMGAAMQLGSMLALAVEQRRYERRQRLVGVLYMDAFEFGLIPAETNRKGVLYFECPRAWPLQIRIKLNDNEYLLKLDNPKKDNK